MGRRHGLPPTSTGSRPIADSVATPRATHAGQSPGRFGFAAEDDGVELVDESVIEQHRLSGRQRILAHRLVAALIARTSGQPRSPRSALTVAVFTPFSVTLTSYLAAVPENRT
jgi:hypothetical protein